MNITVEILEEPKPLRKASFCAYDTDLGQQGPIGYGTTPREATQDLLDQIEGDIFAAPV